MLSNQWSYALSPLEFLGLSTSGEFGPILSVVLGDALHGSIAWGYWEENAGKRVAVFRYTVPMAGSHYQLYYPFGSVPAKLEPAYHGEIAIDPATGVILRVTVISDLAAPHQDFAAKVMLEYGPVSIGGVPYICPVRGVAYSKGPVFARRAGKDVKAPFTQTQLNDIRFSDYHLFRGDVRVVPAPASAPEASARAPQSPAH